ncbi:Uncharacterised protein [Mycobacteroides abscessus subsp. bolletii]|uniref:TPR repeat region-containing protein n=1 Tax=Mycobacteroides abscessus TaxID=36809 RepID=UPI0009C7475A|nr:hypothetical protein [Mycobacteroides abscessus]SKR94605.1 Uncharacterised protein [Mycobacteroides abscessus subsp. bolletii]SKS02796.1 Uncharacterised protein [Mycobacteroides abscessus subsp. bolletii]DAZ90185.1 TPA_asm: WXG-100 motif protein [Mycobacterium phage prophiFVLQ01-1]
MSGYSLRLLLSTKPENSIEGMRQAILAAAELQLEAKAYKRDIDRPGGQDWEGKAATAAQDTAAADEKVVYGATQHLQDEGSEALNTLSFKVKESHSSTVGIYNDLTSHGYRVSEDLTVEWIVPSRTTPELIAKGQEVAARVTREIRGAYDKWFAAEEEAKAEILAIISELNTSYNPIGGLTANAGQLDGAYFQGGTQWDADVLKRVQAAALLSDQELADINGGKKIDIGSNRMQYLYQFAHSFDGKTPEQIAAIKAGLPPEQRLAMSRALAIVANDQVRSGVDNPNGVTEATKKNFIPAAGSLRDLADGMYAEGSRTDRVVSGPLGVGPAADKAGLPNVELRGVDDMQAMAKIFEGAGPYLNGSEAGRAMLDAATEYSNAIIDSQSPDTPAHLTSDAKGPLTDALADIYQSAGQDHVDVHEIVTGEPTEGEKFLRGVLEGNHGDQSGKVDDTMQWAGDHSQMGAEVANELGHYMADPAHKAELQNMAGGGNFAQNNPEMAGTFAKVEGEYLSQFADPDPSHRHDPGIKPFENASQMRDLVSTFDQGQYSGDIINEQARAQHQQLMADAARTGSNIDLNAAGRLSQGMVDGALDSVGPKPTDEGMEDVKKLVGKVPHVSEAMEVLDTAQKHMENATKLPDGFAQNLSESGSFGNIEAYQTSILDALLQAHPEIADDKMIGQYINGNHFDPSTVGATGGPDLARDALSRWFKEVAPRDYNFNMSEWDHQQDLGRTHPHWKSEYGPQR